MTFNMKLSEAQFSATDVIKLMTGVITVTVFALTIHIGLGNLGGDVSEIRETQLENSKKSDLRWSVIEAKQNELDMNQRLFEQRLKALESK